MSFPMPTRSKGSIHKSRDYEGQKRSPSPVYREHERPRPRDIPRRSRQSEQYRDGRSDPHDEYYQDFRPDARSSISYRHNPPIMERRSSAEEHPHERERPNAQRALTFDSYPRDIARHIPAPKQLAPPAPESRDPWRQEEFRDERHRRPVYDDNVRRQDAARLEHMRRDEHRRTSVANEFWPRDGPARRGEIERERGPLPYPVHEKAMRDFREDAIPKPLSNRGMQQARWDRHAVR
ncbi:hypothetical protein K432DRAFT_136288 [Lepidopterella palustris CBS 459.81]|uniref:Uncharacterized protein n=1 Tax=Lepidopterella palustris CBS 459.81 TaxID=1314670 RepID=A0A8E2E408_9PEZI|nr:hypothetical protein K432DRAFT_136288 [Lepidopterella palustris CBS 459.81]